MDWKFWTNALGHALGRQPMENPVPAPHTTPTLATVEGVVAVQQCLTNVGYLDPPADGGWGPLSKYTLEQWCKLMQVDYNATEITPAMQRVLTNPSMSRVLPLRYKAGDLASAIIKTMTQQKMFVSRLPGAHTLVYVEGMDPDGKLNDNRLNAFNDVRCLIDIQSDGTPKFVHAPWYATTEPGQYWGVDHPMNEDGAFHVALNVQQKCHTMGSYHTMSALVQSSPIKGSRDPQHTGKRDVRYLVEGMYGVHHHGGYDLPRNNLGRSSAGCLVGESMEEHERFVEYERGDIRYQVSPVYKFMFAVLDGKLVAANL